MPTHHGVGLRAQQDGGHLHPAEDSPRRDWPQLHLPGGCPGREREAEEGKGSIADYPKHSLLVDKGTEGIKLMPLFKW